MPALGLNSFLRKMQGRGLLRCKPHQEFSLALADILLRFLTCFQGDKDKNYLSIFVEDFLLFV